MKQELENTKIPRAFFDMALELGEGRLANCPPSENFETNQAYNHDDLYLSLGFTDAHLPWDERADKFFKEWSDWVEEAMYRIHQFIEQEAI